MMKLRRWVIAWAVAVLMSTVQACSGYRGPVSDHFDGSHFFNPEPDNTFLDHLKWMWEMEPVEWPDWVEDPPQAAPVARVDDGNVKITYVNHATALIQMDGVNILTDPIWSNRAGPASWLGARRVRAPGVSMDELPEIDLVLISHDHYDHLDIASLRAVIAGYRPVVLMGLGVKHRVETIPGIDAVEMDWWQEYGFSTGLRITFVPSRHHSGRGLFDGNRTLWGGFVIEGPSGRVLFMGDTAFGGFLQDLQERYPRFRVAVLPIGSYEKRWFMKSQHMNPDEAVKVHKMLQVEQSMGIHFGTFREHPEQAIDAHEADLAAALEKNGIPLSRFWIPKFGEGRIFSGARVGTQ